MSTIASGVLGLVQGQASAKGKAVHGKTAGASEKGGFANAVANFHARDGEGGRKGARNSISGTATVELEAAPAGDVRAKTGTRDIPALAEALRVAAETVVEAKGSFGEADEAKGSSDEANEAKSSFGEKAPLLADAAEHPARKVQTKIQTETRDGTRSAAQKADKPVREATDDAEETTVTADKPADKPTAAESDVGNLLELLAAPVAMPTVATHQTGGTVEAALPVAMPTAATHQTGGAVAAALPGAVQDIKGQSGGKAAARVEGVAAKTDGQAGKVDAAQPASADAVEAGDLPQSETDQLFRLIRADGKGRDLDMSIAGAGDRATFRDASPTGPKGETVTVVDARRYIGLAQTGNAAAVTTAITQDPEWRASLHATGGLTHSEAAATGKVVNTLKIQMHPIELGLVTATLRLQGEDLVVSLQVETGDAYRQLSDDQDAIVRALRGQGFAVDQISVQLAPADRSGGSQQGDGQGQQAQQQQFSNQPQAREGGRERGTGEGAGAFGREGRSHEGNTSETASGLSGGQSVRSGGVYL